MKIFTAFISLIICFFSLNAYGEEAPNKTADLFSQAQQEYLENTPEKSIITLQELIKIIRREVANSMTDLLPSNFIGWTQTNLNTNPERSPFPTVMPGANSKTQFNLSATYKSDLDNTRVIVSITNIPHLVQMEQAQINMLFNPMFQEALKKEDPKNIEKLEINGCESYFELIEDENQLVLKIFAYNTSLIKIDCKQTQDKELAKMFADAVNWEKLKSI